MSDISDLLCMHKDIDMLKREISEDFGLPFEDTNPVKECKKCSGYNEICGLYHPIRHTHRKNKNE
jgi:hypothetical protein